MRSVAALLALCLVACATGNSTDGQGQGGIAGSQSFAGGGSGGAATGSGGRSNGSGGIATHTGGSSGSGGTSNSSGGTSNSSGGTSNSSGGSSTGGAGGVVVAPPNCDGGATSDPQGPDLTVGVWTDVTPTELVAHEGSNDWVIGQGLAMDPCAPKTLYWGNTPFDSGNGGLFKTTNGGRDWRRVAKITPAWQGAADHLDEPLHARIDPGNPLHLYAGDGVRGSSQGFFVSTDGGETFELSKGFTDVLTTAGIDNRDIYDVAVDPTDFDHVLLSYHYRWGWTDTKWNTNSGVLESTDGGSTWIAHAPQPGWGSGHAVKFLYEPSLGIGDRNTWLLGTQGDGYWRTSDAGNTWTEVSTNNLQHGGGTIFYNPESVLFASGSPSNMRSTDNGVSWQLTGPGTSTAVFGDGELLWSSPVWGTAPIYTSPENDGITWTPYKNGAQKFVSGGPYEMALDRTHHILYASMWMAGVWALKLQ